MYLTLIAVIDRRVGLSLSHREMVWGRILFWVDGRGEFLRWGFECDLTTSTGSVRRLVAVMIGELTCPFA